jgi:hypothetical protein
VTVGCDSAAPAAPGIPITQGSFGYKCTRSAIYLNLTTIEQDFGFATSGFNTAFLTALSRTIGHGLTVSAGSGTQTSIAGSYSYSTTIGGTLVGSGVSNAEKCASRRYSPGSNTGVVFDGSACP